MCFKPLLQIRSLFFKHQCAIWITESSRQQRSGKPGGANIGLYLAQSNGRLGETSIRMKNRITGIFPSLLCKAVSRLSRILDEPVSVCVAIAIHPIKRSEDVGPNVCYKLEIICAKKIATHRNDKKRSGINAAIISSERNLSERGHLTAPDLMHDLSGLGVLFGNLFGCLRQRQIF